MILPIQNEKNTDIFFDTLPVAEKLIKEFPVGIEWYPHVDDTKTVTKWVEDRLLSTLYVPYRLLIEQVYQTEKGKIVEKQNAKKKRG